MEMEQEIGEEVEKEKVEEKMGEEDMETVE